MLTPESRLRRLYIAALVTIAASVIFGQALVHRTLSRSESDGVRINLAGRQRMLSAHLVRSAAELRFVVPAENRRELRSEIHAVLRKIEHSHELLVHGDVGGRLRPLKSQELIDGMRHLRGSLDALTVQTQELLASETKDWKVEDIADLSAAQRVFVAKMDGMVSAMAVAADGRIERCRRVEYGVLVFTLLLLLCEALFVFRPAVRSIGQSFESLKQRERMIRRRDRRHRDLIRHSGGPILVLDLNEGKIIDINPAGAESIGQDANVLMGKTFGSFLETVSRENLDELWDQLRRGGTVSCELTIETDRGPRRWSTRLTAYRVELGDASVMVTAEDITERSRREAKLLEEARRDQLTGLYNRREFDLRMVEQLEAHQWRGVPFTLAMIDVDDFKSLNDRHGHAAGDAVLKRLSEIIQSCCRSADVVARYGGEEIAVIFPLLNVEDASAIAERIRLALDMTPIIVGETVPLRATVSIGLAGAPSHGTDADALIKAADQALYDAKKRGRNMVRIGGLEDAESVEVDASVAAICA